MEYRVLSVVSATVIYELFEWAPFQYYRRVFNIADTSCAVQSFYLVLLEINPHNSRFHCSTISLISTQGHLFRIM
jgi:hypothetical protein